MDATNTPGYFALIPGSVRFDDGLSATAKLLFGEIASLAQRDGYCFASNMHLAQQFGVTERTVTRTIALLAERGHVKVRLCRAKATGQITGRRIYPLYNPDVPEEEIIEESDTLSHPTKMSGPVDKNVYTLPTKMSTGNNVDNNKKKEEIPPISPTEKTRTRATADDAARQELRAWAERGFEGQTAAVLSGRLMQFCDMRLRKRKPLQPGRAVTALTNKLQRFSGGNVAVMLELLDKSIIACWDSVYPLKDDELRSFGVLPLPQQQSAPPTEEGPYKWL